MKYETFLAIPVRVISIDSHLCYKTFQQNKEYLKFTIYMKVRNLQSIKCLDRNFEFPKFIQFVNILIRKRDNLIFKLDEKVVFENFI